MKAHICKAERIFNFVKLIKCLSILFIISLPAVVEAGGTKRNCDGEWHRRVYVFINVHFEDPHITEIDSIVCIRKRITLNIC